MEPFIPSERISQHVPPVPDMVKPVDMGKPFRELKDDIKKIIELLESIDSTLKEMSKKQK